jgi:hypothetical protein
VNVGDDNSISVQHVTEYRHRPFQRLTFDVTQFSDTKDVTTALLEQVGREARVAEERHLAPIIEITLRGQLGFPNSLLEMKKIRDEAIKLTGALHVRIRNNSVPAEIGETESEEDEGRERVERRVVDLIVAKDKRFKANAANITDAVVGAKRMALSDDEPEKIADFIATQVAKIP